jgi:hypothetical protein
VEGRASREPALSAAEGSSRARTDAKSEAVIAAMETFNPRVTANPENRQRAVIWLFQIIAAKASNIPSGMQMMVTTNGQTFPPCSFIRRLYLSSVERVPEPPGRDDRLITMFIYVRVMPPIPNKSTPTTSMRTQPYDILTPRISYSVIVGQMSNRSNQLRLSSRFPDQR